MPTNSCMAHHWTHPSRPGSDFTGTRNGEELQTTLSFTSSSSCQMRFPSPNFCAGSGQHSTASHLGGQIWVLHDRMGAKRLGRMWMWSPRADRDFIIEDSPLYRLPNGEQDLATLDNDMRSWLASTKLEIWAGQQAHERRSFVWYHTNHKTSISLFY